jgi:penicillin V acylase-like amidase (Ntn superfamily)
LLFLPADWNSTIPSTTYTTFHDSKFLDLPGSYNSSHRFIRAAYLPGPGYNWEW